MTHANEISLYTVCVYPKEKLIVLSQMAGENGVQGWIKRYSNAKTMMNVGLARKYTGLETFYLDIQYQHRITTLVSVDLRLETALTRNDVSVSRSDIRRQISRTRRRA
jgi:hypothetical protein